MCSVTIMRSVLDFMNTLFMLIALLLTVLGVWLYLEQDFGSQLIGLPLSVGIIVVSSFLLLITCVACVGLRNEAWCVLNGYVMLMIFLMAAQASLAYMSLRFRDNMEEQLYQGWLDGSDQLRNTIQDQLTCCGFYAPVDYPGSNCPVSATIGCFPQLENTLERRLLLVSLIAGLVAFLEFIAVIFAIGVVCSEPGDALVVPLFEPPSRAEIRRRRKLERERFRLQQQRERLKRERARMEQRSAGNLAPIAPIPPPMAIRKPAST
ncbi:uncharacterized protein AMSG_09405 [Thecamonas trahens ATCC 50062]|uniref:Tetraspanin n=1 Tax=Thecamonas trahens ATCC 50062 TaxID=461836 RepID=A0A0L0DLD1_THETB|nr:hypothetical protein AMSG_09405 [Thecamonas trahens ATCC 50062]KNC53102.1 hypothetical protein AMSG_09405 [Thecamonas trahens ATCC 50062]|eukprot:XP_013754770.1 hypothetical protein AMSG_09405 [Thecamonas trahens ATCC 50062]